MKYFWLPRIAIAVACYIFYENAHLLADREIIPRAASISADEHVYITTFDYNPLYALSLRGVNILPFSSAIKITISMLGSGIASLSIFKCASRMLCFKKNLALLLISINPFLALYSLKFCTENFLLAGVAIFMAQNLNSQKDSIHNKIKSFTSQLLIFLTRAQAFPLFAYEALKILWHPIAQDAPKTKNQLKRILIITLLFIMLISMLAIFSSKYVSVLVASMWSDIYFFKPADIYQLLGQSSDNWPVIHELKTLLSYILYLAASILLLLGARGRITDLPWQVDIFGFSVGPAISQFTSYSNEYLEALQHTSNSEILLKLIMPFAFFALTNGVGALRWSLANIKIRENIIPCVYPFAITIVPILFFPYMRYFYPLMPFAMIGLCITNPKKTTTMRKFV